MFTYCAFAASHGDIVGYTRELGVKHLRGNQFNFVWCQAPKQWGAKQCKTSGNCLISGVESKPHFQCGAGSS